jgi:uncharacterized membrane protein YkoI
MTRSFGRSRGSLLFALTAALATGCAGSDRDGPGESDHAERVTLEQLPAAARATVQRLLGGGRIEQIDRESEKGRVLYDVEAVVDGKHIEWSIAAADGAMLGSETPIEYGDLPAAVRTAAERHFGSASGLTATKGVEEGTTTYEVAGTQGGRREEVTFDANGTRLE